MSILIDETTRVVIQGATGRHGRCHMSKMLDYGVQVIAGIGPAKGGQTVWGVPIYDTVADAAIAGRNTPEGKKMGHAGAIITGNLGVAESKIRSLRSAGVRIADCLEDIITLLE
jgi:succinyl-CoA synthetase alpha subunit